MSDMSQSNDVREQLAQILSKEVEIEGCQARHSGDKCLHCDTSPCPHCKRWGGQQRTETRQVVDSETIDQLVALLEQSNREAETNAVAWAVKVIDELHFNEVDTLQHPDELYKKVKNIIRGKYEKETGIDPAQDYPIQAELQHPEGREDE